MADELSRLLAQRDAYWAERGAMPDATPEDDQENERAVLDDNERRLSLRIERLCARASDIAASSPMGALLHIALASRRAQSLEIIRPPVIDVESESEIDPRFDDACDEIRRLLSHVRNFIETRFDVAMPPLVASCFILNYEADAV